MNIINTPVAESSSFLKSLVQRLRTSERKLRTFGNRGANDKACLSTFYHWIIIFPHALEQYTFRSPFLLPPLKTLLNPLENRTTPDCLKTVWGSPEMCCHTVHPAPQSSGKHIHLHSAAHLWVLKTWIIKQYRICFKKTQKMLIANAVWSRSPPLQWKTSQKILFQNFRQTRRS